MSTYLVAFIVADFTPISKNVSETLVGLTQMWLPFAFLQLLFNSTIVSLLIECLDVFYICLFKVSVYSVPEKKEHTEYALDTASKLLEFYNNFFEIGYPLKKLGEEDTWGSFNPHLVVLSFLLSLFF